MHKLFRVRRIENFSLAVLFFMCSAVKGQDTLTVQQAIGTALQNNYDIRLAQIDSAGYAIISQVDAFVQSKKF